jgi:sporulation protein YlmC with PRC-barrel domain
MLQQRSVTSLGLALALVLAFSAGPLGAQNDSAADDALPAGLRSLSVHSMLELDVLTADGEALGSVYDLVVDPTDGRLTFLVVEQGEAILGILRTGETRVAVPWHRVEIAGPDRRIVLDMTYEDFEALPTWEGERTEGAGVGAAPIEERPDQEAAVD